MQCTNHRVGRVLSFFSSRRNWNSPTPSHAGECGGVPIPPRGLTLWYSMYICTLWYWCREVYEHVALEHLSIYQLTCEACGEKFKLRRLLEEHLGTSIHPFILTLFIPTQSFIVHSLLHSFTNSYIYWFPLWHFHSLFHSCIHLFLQTHIPTFPHSLIPTSIHWRIYSFPPSFITYSLVRTFFRTPHHSHIYSKHIPSSITPHSFILSFPHSSYPLSFIS